MCVSPEIFNLCKCGCTEADHEEAGMFDSIAVNGLGGVFGPWQRGKCHGRRLLPQDLASARPVFEDCPCKAFDPVFKNMCGGF